MAASARRLEQNKSNAVAFYDLMFNRCQPAEAVMAYVGDRYIQHNPEVADGRAAFIAACEYIVPGIRRGIVPGHTDIYAHLLKAFSPSSSGACVAPTSFVEKSTSTATLQSSISGIMPASHLA